MALGSLTPDASASSNHFSNWRSGSFAIVAESSEEREYSLRRSAMFFCIRLRCFRVNLLQFLIGHEIYRRNKICIEERKYFMQKVGESPFNLHIIPYRIRKTEP